MVCGSPSLNMNHYQYLPWFPSEYHPLFLTIIVKICATKCPKKRKRVGPSAVWAMPKKHIFFILGLPLYIAVDSFRLWQVWNQVQSACSDNLPAAKIANKIFSWKFFLGLLHCQVHHKQQSRWHRAKIRLQLKCAQSFGVWVGPNYLLALTRLSSPRAESEELFKQSPTMVRWAADWVGLFISIAFGRIFPCAHWASSNGDGWKMLSHSPKGPHRCLEDVYLKINPCYVVQEELRKKSLGKFSPEVSFWKMACVYWCICTV